MITDTEARRISSAWHGGAGTALYALASTGAIDTARADHDIGNELRDCIEAQKPLIRNGPTIIERRDAFHGFSQLTDLEQYIYKYGPRGPQEGWADLSW